MKLVINNNGKKIKLEVRKVKGIGKFFGLMFRRVNSYNLLFDFGYNVKYSLHSFFVFFPFLVLWLDIKNNVIDYKIAKPFCFRIICKNSFRKVVEIPINERNEKIIRNFM